MLASVPVSVVVAWLMVTADASSLLGTMGSHTIETLTDATTRESRTAEAQATATVVVLHDIPSDSDVNVGSVEARIGANAGGRPGRENRCDSNGRSVNLVLVDDADTDPSSIDAAEREASAIWARAGVRLVWMRPGLVADVATTARPHLSIVIRRRLAIPDAAKSGAEEAHTPLGWVSFDDGGHPAGRLEVSLAAVVATVMSTSYTGVALSALPRSARYSLIGRAMGRVMAHELGHWLFGREHTEKGLMRAGLSGVELTEWAPPTLPRTWADEFPGRLAARLPSCEREPERMSEVLVGR